MGSENRSRRECVNVDYSGTDVCRGDEFKIVEENQSLLGLVTEGSVFEVVGFESLPSGVEVVVEFRSTGREARFSPTTLGEALGVADYESAPNEACLSLIE